MSERHRTLPSWMAKKEIKIKEKKAPLKTQKKRRASSRATFYCMNEAELVEAAVLCLTNRSCDDVTSLTHQQVEKQAKNTLTAKSKPSQMKAEPLTGILEESSSDCCVDLETTYVSETDLDITEVEPLPNNKNPQYPESEGERSRPAQGDHKLMNINIETEKGKQIPENAAEEDEALQLVRAIFFT